MIDLFIQALEAYLGIKHTKVSRVVEWSRSGPEKLRDKSIIDVQNVGQILLFLFLFCDKKSRDTMQLTKV